MKIKPYIFFFLILVLNGCNKDDENSNDENPIESEIVVVAERIEFSANNVIPSNLSILSYNGETEVGTSEITEPNNWNKLEMLVDENNKPLFLKRNYPNYNSNKINSTSTVLFLATYNTRFNRLPNSIQSQIIGNLLGHPIFGNLVNHINQQAVLDLYSEYITENLILLITDIYNIDLTINENNWPVAEVFYNENSIAITIQNPTNNYTAYGVYDNNVIVDLQLIPPTSEISFNLPNSNIDYDIRVMSGENVTNPSSGNLKLEEIEAFNEDMLVFLEDAFSFILGPFDLEDSCFIEAYNTIYSGVDFVEECSDVESTLESVRCALDFGFLAFNGALQLGDSCDLIDIESTTEILNLLGEILEAFDGSELLASIAVRIQDFYLYENQFDICLKTDGNGVYLCGTNNTEPALNPNPLDNQTDVLLDGTLTFEQGQNTPTNATFRILFDQNPNPFTQYDVGMQATLDYTDLDFNTTYYWKVETISNTNTVLATSPIWSFTTISENDETVIDVDGNVYETITIGNQIWLSSNLKVTKFPDGSPIPLVISNLDWENLSDNDSDKAYSWYNNDINNKEVYGALYTYSAVVNGDNSGNNVQGICPDGWHVPNFDETIELRDFFSNPSNAGGELKQEGFSNWITPNTGATNSVGFNSVPGGNRFNIDGSFLSIGLVAEYYTSTEVTSATVRSWAQGNESAEWFGGTSPKSKGKSCRCIKN